MKRNNSDERVTNTVTTENAKMPELEIVDDDQVKGDNALVRHEIIAKYDEMEPILYVQYDTYTTQGLVFPEKPDEDDSMHFTLGQHEPMRGSDVRLLINPRISPDKAIYALQQLESWIAKDSRLKDATYIAELIEYTIDSNSGDLMRIPPTPERYLQLLERSRSFEK